MVLSHVAKYSRTRNATSKLFTWTINSNWTLAKYKLVKVRICLKITPLYKSTFSNLLNQVHAVAGVCLFFEIVFVYTSVCVSVYLPEKALITSGVIWYDIGHVWLVKPILQLLSLLPLINWMGVALVTQHITHTRQSCWS